jgi:hypothetical protein
MEEIFLEFLQHFIRCILPWKAIIVIMDMHSSHVSADVPEDVLVQSQISTLSLIHPQ